MTAALTNSPAAKLGKCAVCGRTFPKKSLLCYLLLHGELPEERSLHEPLKVQIGIESDRPVCGYCLAKAAWLSTERVSLGYINRKSYLKEGEEEVSWETAHGEAPRADIGGGKTAP